jgi:hypothetical protein
MFRSTLIAAGAVLLCSTGFAQQQLDSSKIRPVTVPVKDAGVFNWDTKQWVSGPKAGFKATNYTIWRNDCTWTGGSFFYAPEHCEDVISQGTIPAPSTPGAPLGATVDNQVTNFTFAYCTGYATGGVDIKIGFYDNLGGDCAGASPVRPPTLASQAAPFQPALAPLGTATAFFDFGSASGFPLPGSTLNGKQGCWSLGFTFAQNSGFCLQSEGDGTWDNSAAADKFAWSFRHENPNTTFGLAGGPFIKGEPSTGGFGAGSYNIPVGSDALFNVNCGTGAGTEFDAYWVNVDGSAPGVQNTIVNATGVVCKGAAGAGSNCYWFGGWPGGPLSAFWMVMGANGDCGGCSNRAVNYCTAGTSASGCQAFISASGASSATASSGFFLTADEVQGSNSGTNGLFYFSANGRQAQTIGTSSSWQCVVAPVFRSQAVIGGGSNGNCDASFSVDLNARWQAKPPSNPGVGATVQAQLWYRDPQNTSNQSTSRSNAVEWTVCP